MSEKPLSLRLYAGVMRALSPIAPAILEARAKAGKEDRERIGERLGKTPITRPDGALVWLHGVSVGESLSLLPLIGRIQAERPELALLVTSGTVTSAEILKARLPPGVIHQFAPIDSPDAVGGFLDHWKPKLGIFAESELWPNLIATARARGVRLALISARITEKTAKGWQRRPTTAKALLGAFELILPQDVDSAVRLNRLGARTGPQLNLKQVGEPLPFDETAFAELKAAIGDRRVVVAASTHLGEEDLIAEAVAAQPASPPLLIIVPRHPDRGEAVVGALRAQDFVVARRSLGEPILRDTEIYVADTLGETGLFYRLASVAVVGGSFREGIGGHNPLEPARLGAPIVTGPHIFNFADVYAALTRGVAGAIVAHDKDDLRIKLHAVLSQKPLAASMIKRAAAYAEAQSEAFESGWLRIKALLP